MECFANNVGSASRSAPVADSVEPAPDCDSLLPYRFPVFLLYISRKMASRVVNDVATNRIAFNVKGNLVLLARVADRCLDQRTQSASQSWCHKAVAMDRSHLIVAVRHSDIAHRVVGTARIR